MFQPVDELGRFANWPIRFANFGQFATPLPPVRKLDGQYANLPVRISDGQYANECDYNLKVYLW